MLRIRLNRTATGLTSVVSTSVLVASVFGQGEPQKTLDHRLFQQAQHGDRLFVLSVTSAGKTFYLPMLEVEVLPAKTEGDDSAAIPQKTPVQLVPATTDASLRSNDDSETWNRWKNAFLGQDEPQLLTIEEFAERYPEIPLPVANSKGVPELAEQSIVTALEHPAWRLFINKETHKQRFGVCPITQAKTGNRMYYLPDLRTVEILFGKLQENVFFVAKKPEGQFEEIFLGSGLVDLITEHQAHGDKQVRYCHAEASDYIYVYAGANNARWPETTRLAVRSSHFSANDPFVIRDLLRQAFQSPGRQLRNVILTPVAFERLASMSFDARDRKALADDCFSAVFRVDWDPDNPSVQPSNQAKWHAVPTPNQYLKAYRGNSEPVANAHPGRTLVHTESWWGSEVAVPAEFHALTSQMGPTNVRASEGRSYAAQIASTKFKRPEFGETNRFVLIDNGSTQYYLQQGEVTKSQWAHFLENRWRSLLANPAEEDVIWYTNTNEARKFTICTGESLSEYLGRQPSAGKYLSAYVVLARIRALISKEKDLSPIERKITNLAAEQYSQDYEQHPDRPMGFVSPEAAELYCRWLSAEYAGVPTDAQWKAASHQQETGQIPRFIRSVAELASDSAIADSASHLGGLVYGLHCNAPEIVFVKGQWRAKGEAYYTPDGWSHSDYKRPVAESGPQEFMAHRDLGFRVAVSLKPKKDQKSEPKGSQ
ncbi:MAG TPA: SUMF1/EgtB/PvdO family nonheme iron enzyme [Phycisphaerae bacterium]|nr:SUMF1/EgtB/PvdO family nonheme iron enzyme [Phycisphaerae bacterium]